MKIEPFATADQPQADAILDEAFGPARRMRTASRLRAGCAMLPDLSFAARADGRLIGSVQCWPLSLIDGAHAYPLIMLGPIAVSREARGSGAGSALMRAAVDAAGGRAMMLIGDEPFYGRFGFSAADTAGWVLPGPVERERLLARDAGQLPVNGAVVAQAPVRRAA